MSTTEHTPINPELPKNFDSTPNDARPASHQRWWNRPYIQTSTAADLGLEGEALERWMDHWPSGTRYDVRCLDGGAWDRSTNWGSYATLEEALAAANGDTEQ